MLRSSRSRRRHRCVDAGAPRVRAPRRDPIGRHVDAAIGTGRGVGSTHRACAHESTIRAARTGVPLCSLFELIAPPGGQRRRLSRRPALDATCRWELAAGTDTIRFTYHYDSALARCQCRHLRSARPPHSSRSGADGSGGRIATDRRTRSTGSRRPPSRHRTETGRSRLRRADRTVVPIRLRLNAARTRSLTRYCSCTSPSRKVARAVSTAAISLGPGDPEGGLGRRPDRSSPRRRAAAALRTRPRR